MITVILNCPVCDYIAHGINAKQARVRLKSHRRRVHSALREALDRTGLTAPRTFRHALREEIHR